MPPPRRKKLAQRTEGIFVNREAPLQVFADAATAIPDQGAILRVFFGVGGQGKTALCQELIRIATAKEDPIHPALRCAHLDLHRKPKTDPDLLLVWIRNGFAKAGVGFPAFDLALALTWEATRGEQPFPKLENAWLARSADALSGAAPDAVQILRETVERTVETIPGLGVLIRKGSKWVIDRTKRAYIEGTRDFLKELYRDGELKKPYELSELLPWMLAQDLNYHLKNHPHDRFVLLVDEYERVFEEGGIGARWRENLFDRHMRALVQECDGLLAVFFTRERMPWHDDPDWREDLRDAQFLLGGLAADDADAWLRQIPIDDPGVRAAIIAGAREDPKSGAVIYPLLLDLQVEHWRHLMAAGTAVGADLFHVSAATFEGRCRELVGRILRDYGDPLQLTLERLSVADRFDRRAFEYVVTHFGTGLPFDSFDRIAGLSFIAAGEDGFLVLHGSVVEAIRATLDPEIRRSSMDALLAHYWERAETGSPREVSDDTISALVEANALRRQLDPEGYVPWLAALVTDIVAAAQFATAEQLWRGAVETVETALGPNHPDTAASYNNLAYSLTGQGRYGEAEPLYRKALDIHQEVLGEAHPNTASCYDNVAANLNAQGRYDQAEPLYGKALDIRQQVHGDAHPLTAASYNNLASNLFARGHYDEAEPLYRKALDVHLAVHGEVHSATATSYNNVAANLNAKGRFAEAEPLYRKALDIRLEALGESHPDTASGYNNLASNLNAQGRYGEAEPLARKALDFRLEELGESHPLTATSYNNVAFNLKAQGRYDKAEPFCRKALDIRRAVLGEAHPDTVASYNSIAVNLNAQKRHDEAEPLFREVLDKRREMLGEAHPDTATSYNNLAANLNSQGYHDEAEVLYRKALGIRREGLGEAHPDTADSYNNLASNLDDQERYEEAEPLFRKALDIRLDMLGDAHPDTAVSYNNVASNLEDQARYDEAEPLYRKALGILERTLGQDHPTTNTIRENIRLFQAKLGGRD